MFTELLYAYVDVPPLANARVCDLGIDAVGTAVGIILFANMPRPNLVIHRKSSLEGSSSRGSTPDCGVQELIADDSMACVPRTRAVLLLRHGEGTHNCRAERWGGGNPWDTLDPLLTQNGVEQAAAVAKDPRLAEVDLIVVSPLSRAIQTATTIFGEKSKCRTVLTPLHSERWSALCDEGRPKSALVETFPFIAGWEGFDALPEAWTPTKDTDAEWQRKRVPAFIAWLKAQPEERIVAIGHGAYFAALLGKHLKNCEIGEIEI